MSQKCILRRWSSRIRTSDEDAYGDYVRATGLSDYKATTGNLGAEILMRRLEDDTTEVTTLSWWRSMEAIEAFAGSQPELARYYPDDDRFLLEKPLHVEHHSVIASTDERAPYDLYNNINY
jgi:heme-degrading monooxygenase HmoA